MKMVDTHLHCWDLDRFPYSWTKGIEALNRSFLIDEYKRGIDGHAVEKALFMECDVDPDHGLAEAKWIQELSEREPLITGIIATAKPGDYGFRERLERLRVLEKVKGIRRVLHTQEDDLSRSEFFRANLRMLPEFGYTYDLCVLEKQLPVALELVRACPEVGFVLDHCGVPDVKGGKLEPWKTNIARLAKEDNVLACKISGLVAYAEADNWGAKVLRPWFEHVIDCFGWDRVVWGGDWPVCTLVTDIGNWIQVSKELCSGASESEQAKLFHVNAERIYRV